MKPKQGQIFLSYSRKDVGLVNELYEKLKAYGFCLWQDHRNIIGGRWLDAIKKAIKDSSLFIICISENSINQQTGVLAYEINEALEMMNYRHRSHISILPVRFDESLPPEELAEFQWFDLFSPDGFDKLLRALRLGLKQLGIDNLLNLRSYPLDNLTPAEVGAMIQSRNFYSNLHWLGAGIHHEYETRTLKNDIVVIDHTTNLMWQQGGSDSLGHLQAGDYIYKLNDKRFAGFSDWHLPTIEEAMSLMENRKCKNGLYIADVFDITQKWIWTVDKSSNSKGWGIDFELGSCVQVDIAIFFYYGYFRAVRLDQSV